MTVPFHILLVDDSDLIASRVPELFQDQKNIFITIVKDTASAREFIRSTNAQLVLLDISLNGSNGIDFLKHLNSIGSEIPVVMLTNQASRKHRALCSSLGCYDFLDKTTEFERLLPVVNGLIDQR